MPIDPWSLTNVADEPAINPIIAASPHLVDVVEARARAGHLSAVVPRQLLTHPIWLHPKTASSTSSMHRVWWDVIDQGGKISRWKRNTEVVNPTAPDAGTGCSPHGMLRFLDLDVVMALSHAWIMQGDDIEVAQADLLRWMGHDNLLTAPYDELRASLRRLESTLMVFWDGEADARPSDARRHRIVEGADFTDGPRNSTIVAARLSPMWIEALKSGRWQELDLDAYAHLTRTQRRAGLARVIYAFLTSQRDRDGRFCLPKDAIVQRYTPRKPDQRRKRYADDADPRSALVRALTVLRESGVIEPDRDAPDTHLAGRFVMNAVPRLSDQGMQRRLCTLDIWGGGQAPRVAGPGPDQATTPSAAPLPPLTEQPVPPERTPEQLSVIMLNRELRVGKAAFQTAISKQGWSPRQILHLMTEVYWLHKFEGQVERPAGLFVAKLRDSAPTHYDDPPQPAWDWLRQSWPSLPVFKAAPKP